MIHGTVIWQWNAEAEEWILSPIILPKIKIGRVSVESSPPAEAGDAFAGFEGPAELDNGSELTVVPEEFFVAVPGVMAGKSVQKTTIDGTADDPVPTFRVLVEIPSIGEYPVRVIPGKVSRVLIGRDILGQLLFIMDSVRGRWTLAANSIFGRLWAFIYHSAPRRRIRRPV